ncbi:pyridoxal-phosphate dependent enzyme [Nonomuraea sp. NBC_01738]|uniref:threonine synthase n=1 Tax=Nonomuraea sp. NBC_01738 TaxID=2976003 RepID=UPI002E0F095D|nr:pyridoxal-phosphate dependent enzyme [Nonomuraea sp. NBC_01738]
MTASRALLQRSLGDPSLTYPLWPPLTRGCPGSGDDRLVYPLEVDYDYDAVGKELFEQEPGTDLARWAPLLPPLDAPTLGEGGTPLLELGDVFVKDESRNPTWSHKDRLNRVTVSAAVATGAPGVVVASSGNHGASAAAFAARAGLHAVVLASAGSPPAVQTFVRAYGGKVLTVPVERRWSLLREIVDNLGYHPVSNQTRTHTGHPFGPEGYKTIAYELFLQLGRRVPAAVFAPVGYGEMFFGIWKGFTELRRLGLAGETPKMFACEPAGAGPTSVALHAGLDATIIEVGESAAYAIATEVGGYRAVRTVRDSGGDAVPLTDDEMFAAQADLARAGLWQEVSGAAGLAGYRKLGREFDGPVVCVATSSGFKDLGVGQAPVTVLENATWRDAL